ncbi:MAG: hypothetical protein V3T58_03150 [Candidatus Hydrothermarchaeales archaeon]
MDEKLKEDITYYYDTLKDKVEDLRVRWGRLPWETKVRVKAGAIASGTGSAYFIYYHYWGSLGRGGQGLLFFLVLGVLLLLATTLWDVFGSKI